MICGTIHIEDLTLHFHLPDSRDGKVTVRVQEGLRGETAKIECGPRAFAASLALALDFNGMEDAGDELVKALYAYAETVEFPSRELRWIP